MTTEPESVDVGDFILVLHDKDKFGVIHELKGRVHRRGDAGQYSTLYTEEGGELLTWARHSKRTFRVIIIEKAPAPQEPLSIFNELSR